MKSYPIDSHTSGAEGSNLLRNPSVVLHAPPGAGKTTRVPLALLDLIPPEKGRIIMLEPRRIAAVSAARWMAKTIGEEAGQTVGYSIRFESRTSEKTRIEVVTEGILTRRIQSDPGLEGVAMVIFDEFHERSLQADLALSLMPRYPAGSQGRSEGPYHVCDTGLRPDRILSRAALRSLHLRAGPFL